MIFNIQKCSIHDGEGLRTLVFFKGCPLRCLWCANPESQRFSPEVMESTNKCIGCLACKAVCSADAIVPGPKGPLIDREKCTGCLACANACFARAKYITGEEMDEEKLFHEIEKDRLFYDGSQGGVTFSGGEPFAQSAFLSRIARRCQEEGIDVMVETCGCAPYEKMTEALPYLDGMFFDVKHIDPERHRALTGRDNTEILENLRRIAAQSVPITVRTPVVPGYNDETGNITGIARFLRELPGVCAYELLPYHNLGESKYRALGRPYALSGIAAPDEETMRRLVDAANEVLAGSGKECFYLRAGTVYH